MTNTESLTKELYRSEITPEQSRDFLRKLSRPEVTYDAAKYFSPDTCRPPENIFYDNRLSGTGIQAYVVDPREVGETYPVLGKQLETELGSDKPAMGVSPDLPVAYYRGRIGKSFIDAVADHEHIHPAQPAKLEMKRLGYESAFGYVPLGEMIVEGSTEWALERRKEEMAKKGKFVAGAPSRYFDRMGQKSTYGIYRDFIYEIERKEKGITRQLWRAAKHGGANSVAKLLQNVSGIEEILDRYAYELNGKMSHSIN
jgi:hypothetical protein